MRALVTPDELATLLSRGEVRVLDVQYNLRGTPGPELYAAAHLPGAPHLDLDAALAGAPGVRGRHPLPDPAVLQEALRACGVGDDDEVVVYDQATSLAAGRAWWVLRWAGHPQVRVLDGGLAAWRRAGMPVTDEVPTPAPGDLTVRPGSVPVLDSGGAVDMARHGVLLDARAAERYRGEVEPIDRVAGHIPGSANLPMTDLLTPDGRFLPPTRCAAGRRPSGCTATPRWARRAGRASRLPSSPWPCTPPASTPSPTWGRGASGSRTRRGPWRPAIRACRCLRTRPAAPRPGRRRRPGRAGPR